MKHVMFTGYTPLFQLIVLLMVLYTQQYQALFRNGECFLHIVSLLNGNLDAINGEKLVLNVLQTLTSLLSGNEASKVLSIFMFPSLAVPDLKRLLIVLACYWLLF